MHPSGHAQSGAHGAVRFGHAHAGQLPEPRPLLERPRMCQHDREVLPLGGLKLHVQDPCHRIGHEPAKDDDRDRHGHAGGAQRALH